MKKWTEKELIAQGYEIENGRITNVSLNMKNYASLTFDLTIEGGGWGTVYGGYKLGYGYLGSDEFKGSEKGLEAVMRIMDTIGVDELTELNGQYVRIASKGIGDSVKIIGNIIKDKWFDYGTFFE